MKTLLSIWWWLNNSNLLDFRLIFNLKFTKKILTILSNMGILIIFFSVLQVMSEYNKCFCIWWDKQNDSIFMCTIKKPRLKNNKFLIKIVGFILMKPLDDRKYLEISKEKKKITHRTAGHTQSKMDDIGLYYKWKHC